MDPIARNMWNQLPALTSAGAEEVKRQVEETLKRGDPVFVVEADGTRTRVVKAPWRQGSSAPEGN